MLRFLIVNAFAAIILGATAAQATVSVAIDLSRQNMHVTSASGAFDWPISSARSGFYTPGGSYAPTRMEVMHYSHKYHMSPMPHAIFFRGGYAIHGTYATESLGRPASHGCVRLSPGNAAHLYDMVKAEGARISISGTPPLGATRYARTEQSSGEPDARHYGYGRAGYDEQRAAARHQRIESEYATRGYHFIGRLNGHDMYQATQPASQGLFGDWSE